MLRATIPLTGFGYLLAKDVYLVVCEDGLMCSLSGAIKRQKRYKNKTAKRHHLQG